MLIFTNLCPHDIVLLIDSKETVFPRSGNIARREEMVVPAGSVNGIPVVRKVYGPVENLPEPRQWEYFIVSGMVREALPDRKDLLSPGETVRDAQGRIIAVKNFATN